MSDIAPEETIWYPGPDYRGREGRYAKPASEVSWNMLFALVQQRAEEDGEWAIENNRVGGRPELMRKMMKWVSDSENIVQCLETNRDQNPTVDWICRELANATKAIGRRRHNVKVGRKVRSMHLEGFSAAEIANEIGVSEDAVQEGLKEFEKRDADD